MKLTRKDKRWNLRSFSKQKVCTKCNAKYRRPPLCDACPEMRGNVVLTVHEGSIINTFIRF